MPKYPKVPKGWYSADCIWCVPGRKRPIAYSTRATMDYIVMLSKDGGTIREVHDRLNYCEEGKRVLVEYIKRGFGDITAKDFFKEC